MGRGSAGASPSGAAKGQRARPGRSSSPTLWGRSLKTPRRLGVSSGRCWCSKAGITRRGPRSARRHPRRGPTTKRARAARRGRLVHSQVRADGNHTRVPQGRRRFTAALFGHGEMKKLRFQRHCVELTEHTSAHERDRRQKMAHGTMPPARRSGTGTTAVWSADGAAVPGRGEQQPRGAGVQGRCAGQEGA